jgi:recombinational DNA repair protein RecR
MYEHVRTQNTYAWITDTASSNPISATKIANGISVNAATIIPDVNSLNRNVERIFSSV